MLIDFIPVPSGGINLALDKLGRRVTGASTPDEILEDVEVCPIGLGLRHRSCDDEGWEEFNRRDDLEEHDWIQLANSEGVIEMLPWVIEGFKGTLCSSFLITLGIDGKSYESRYRYRKLLAMEFALRLLEKI